MSYAQIWEYVYANFDINAYLTPEQLIYDVEQMFNQSKSYFPVEAKDLIRERFQYRREYAEMQRIQDERKQIAEVIGGGQVYQSLSDEILDEMNKPEIMGVDISEYATTRETVVPPDIVKFAEREGFFGRLTKRFARFFGRK